MTLIDRRFTLSTDDTVLPRGTRAITRAHAVDVDGTSHRPGVHVVVRDRLEDGRYAVDTVKGARLELSRSMLGLERPDLLAALALRQHDHDRLAEHVVLSVVVGSRAWGLADAGSDEDVRGCFVVPFDDGASVYDAADEIHAGEAAFWEIGKFVRQGLRADPNTLETLWSPLVKSEVAIGARLRRERAIFSSKRVIESFGRYAQSQLKKLERSAVRREQLAVLLDEIAAGRAADVAAASRLVPGEDVHALVRSLFDRGLLSSSSYPALLAAVAEAGAAALLPDEVRPKNAYNLVRLLHSCAHWIEHGEPLIVVDGALKPLLLSIKRSEISLAKTLEYAADAVALVDERVQRGVTPLKDEPDVDAADALLRQARRDAARVVFATSSASSASSSSPSSSSVGSDRFVCRFAPTPLPLDVDLPALRSFMVAKAPLVSGPFLVVGLTGAHAYGFPSPDSDLDLKAIHVGRAPSMLGLSPRTDPLELVEDWQGREMDLSSHELHQAAGLLLKGNGNMLERLLGPCVVLRSPAGEELTALAKRLLSTRVSHHYRGFFERMLVDHEKMKATSSSTAKKLLYAYRVALTGAHLLGTGELVTDVRELAPRYGFDVTTLLEMKRTREKAPVVDDAFFVADAVGLRALLEDKRRTSVLPDAPDEAAVKDLDSFIADVALASTATASNL